MKRILQVLKHGGRVLLGKNRAGRRLTVFEDDIFLVSYPRSGNTWTRFLLGNLINPDEPVTFANIESRVPEIYLFADRFLTRLPRPRVLKSHEYFDPRYQTVVYIVRDPRDVAVSLYDYSVKRANIPEGYPIEHFVPRFIAGEFFSGAGTWHEHVASWLATRQGQKFFLLLKYEDMLENTEREIGKVAEMLKISVTPQKLARIVELSSADRMRSLEKEQSRQWKLTRNTRQDKPFVRTAKAGGWGSVLHAQSVAEIEASWGSLMHRLGYELVTSPQRKAEATMLASS